jgi:hypothetical protein
MNIVSLCVYGCGTDEVKVKMTDEGDCFTGWADDSGCFRVEKMLSSHLPYHHLICVTDNDNK